MFRFSFVLFSVFALTSAASTADIYDDISRGSGGAITRAAEERRRMELEAQRLEQQRQFEQRQLDLEEKRLEVLREQQDRPVPGRSQTAEPKQSSQSSPTVAKPTYKNLTAALLAWHQNTTNYHPALMTYMKGASDGLILSDTGKHRKYCFNNQPTADEVYAMVLSEVQIRKNRAKPEDDYWKRPLVEYVEVALEKSYGCAK